MRDRLMTIIPEALMIVGASVAIHQLIHLTLGLL